MDWIENMEERLVDSGDRVVSLTEMVALDQPESPTVTDHAPQESALETRDLRVYYGDFLAIRDVKLEAKCRKITAIVGPSGCGKTTLLRSLNRINELVPVAHTEGQVIFQGQDLYAKGRYRIQRHDDVGGRQSG